MEDFVGSSADLYKYKNKPVETIQKKREFFLKDQKRKRHETVDRNRQLKLFLEEVKQSELHPYVFETQMECCDDVPDKKPFKLCLMLTDWFTDIPDDLEENWLVKFAPEGYRVLLVAAHGITRILNERGKVIRKIQSNFPGGSASGVDQRFGTTILDCILNSHNKTIFVLDCISWNNMTIIDSEASFRFYWLHSKFEECPKLSKCLDFKFVLLSAFPAQRILIQDKMSNVLSVMNCKYFYDGVVFYHCESAYTFGYSPLVGWLASYMLPEMLNVDVASENLKRKPSDYTDVQSFIRNCKKKGRNKKPPPKMDVDV